MKVTSWKSVGFMAPLLWILCMAGCREDAKNEDTSDKEEMHIFAIDSKDFKQRYVPGEELILRIQEDPNQTIDSVIYYVNEAREAKAEGNDSVRYALSDGKFGIQVIKAIVYSNGVEQETAVRVDFLPASEPKLRHYRLVNTYPHDIKAYTQGLEFYGDYLIESTGNGEGPSGNKGKSSVRIVKPVTGEIVRKVELDDAIFGEGATVLNDKLYQLTYRNNEAYVYNVHTLEKVETLPYFQYMEGWGLTNDGERLYMSDGSERIYILNPKNFSKIDYFSVATSKSIVKAVNELEWVDGKIYANFYGEDLIGIINPENGAVEALIDLAALREKVTPHIDLDVLNGIAYNNKTKTFFVTGKNWDKIFEIEVLP
ncbi:glutamine cyclotransferase [Sphingobacterium allocomposti]|uniref:Glutamine cyclotransferase n=1 Tax=Sphingobacterium allocomposti TaxID=415956 RepID=A0A5S5DDT9_9SPHI|nr:glutaminyl-peptide cyclotransferase [Sphingobacterium composti Yoo et al. 2007 non Ten et al. 2007]TYP94203.1 glutamine cyclotransferase [Sphingobacterium composti Yoo et al. 2007 non Ten et al. 2007]